MNMHRILGIGDNTIDTYVSTQRQYPGGNAVNVAVLTRRLGASSAYLGCVGNDPGGDLLRRSLLSEGVDTSRMRIREGGNARTFIAHEGADRRFLGSDPGVRSQYDLKEADFEYAAGFDLAHTSIYSDMVGPLPRLRQEVGRTSFDYSNRWNADYLESTLPHVDLAFLSAPDLDARACKQLLDRSIELGAKIAVITRGSGGALAADSNSIHMQGVVACELVDTLGAGDAFISAFLLAHLEGQDLPGCLKAGAEFAAEACGWLGGFGHGEAWIGDSRAWPAK